MANQEAVDPGTLDLILQSAMGRLDSQAHDMDASDAKIVQVFASASIIIGLTSFAGKTGGEPTTVSLVPALFFYVIAIGISAYGLWPRSLNTPFNTNLMWKTHNDATVYEIKHALVDNRAIDYPDNQKIITAKSRATKVLIVATAAEALAVGVALFLS